MLQLNLPNKIVADNVEVIIKVYQPQPGKQSRSRRVAADHHVIQDLPIEANIGSVREALSGQVP